MAKCKALTGLAVKGLNVENFQKLAIKETRQSVSFEGELVISQFTCHFYSQQRQYAGVCIGKHTVHVNLQ